MEKGTGGKNGDGVKNQPLNATHYGIPVQRSASDPSIRLLFSLPVDTHSQAQTHTHTHTHTPLSLSLLLLLSLSLSLFLSHSTPRPLEWWARESRYSYHLPIDVYLCLIDVGRCADWYAFVSASLVPRESVVSRRQSASPRRLLQR